MPYDRFLIAPVNTGLETDLKPWLIPDDAFTTLNNAYVFRGRVKKRFGSQFMGTQASQQTSRLRIAVGTLGAPLSPVPLGKGAIGQMFSIGDVLFTVNVLGAPMTLLVANGSAAVKTFNTTTGAFAFAGVNDSLGNPLPAGTIIYFYPALPVMGFTLYETGSVDNQPLYAFDTRFAYLFTGSGWDRSGTAVFQGNDTNFFWSCNWEGLTPNVVTIFTTNFNVGAPNGPRVSSDDPIWYTQDGTTWTSALGANAFYFFPNGGAPKTGPYVLSARIIVAFKNRLVLLNTIENDNGVGLGTNSWYPGRARYCHNGSPFSVNAWYEPNQTDNVAAPNTGVGDGGGFIDAATEENIVSAEFIKDRLIVYFERSTWELAYSGNDVQPFNWQKINTELGSESTFSTVPFDQQILTIGNTGVHSCNGANVARIDIKIPDTVFTIRQDNDGIDRVAGIRDYSEEVVYWTFPTENAGKDVRRYPNKVFLYNYRNGSWAFNDDVFTAFGYFEQQSDFTWANALFNWTETNYTWISNVLQAQSRQVVAGNQQGWTLLIIPDLDRNSPSLEVANATITNAGGGGNPATLNLTIIDHTLPKSSFIFLENMFGLTNASLKAYKVVEVVDKDNIQVVSDVILGAGLSGTYAGGGTAARISQIDIQTKRFNPYVQKGRNLFLAKVDFAVERTAAGEITVDYFPGSSALSILNNAIPGAILGNSILQTSPYDPALYPLEQVQDLLWHPVYFQSDGQFIQLRMYFSDNQLFQPSIAFAPFVLEGFCLYTQPTSQRMN